MMSARAGVVLLVLAGVALGMALVVSLVVPPEWNSWFSPPVRVGATPPGAVPTPISPDLTPTPDGRPPFSERDVRVRVWAFLLPGERDGLVGFAGRVAGGLLLLTTGAILLYLLPGRLGRIAAAVRPGPATLGRLALTGLAGYLLLGVLGVLAVLSSFGTPTWLILGLAAYAASLLGLVAISLPLGRWLLRRAGAADQPPLADLLAGLLGVCILGLLPLVGLLILLGLAALSLGAVLHTRGGSADGWDFDLGEVRY